MIEMDTKNEKVYEAKVPDCQERNSKCNIVRNTLEVKQSVGDVIKEITREYLNILVFYTSKEHTLQDRAKPKVKK